MDFYQWLLDEKKLSKATASKYNLVINNRILDWLPSYELPNNTIEFEALKQMIYSLDIYQERNRIGNNMYSSALNHYGTYLKTNHTDDGVSFEENQTFISEVEKLIKVRLTQNKFRKALFDAYQCCAISGFNNPQFLIASHIKPWSKSNELERLDPYNGFLLTPTYDRLFDRGFISFKLDGTILLSEVLSLDDREFFNIPQQLFIKPLLAHKKYLEFHFDEIFKG